MEVLPVATDRTVIRGAGVGDTVGLGVGPVAVAVGVGDEPPDGVAVGVALVPEIGVGLEPEPPFNVELLIRRASTLAVIC